MCLQARHAIRAKHNPSCQLEEVVRGKILLAEDDIIFHHEELIQSLPAVVRRRKWRHLHFHLSLDCGGRWDTTDNFTNSFLHFSLFSTAFWDLANSRPVHSLMLSSHLFFCLPCLLPLSLCLARWLWLCVYSLTCLNYG